MNREIIPTMSLDSGLTPEQTAERMNVPVKFVNACSLRR